jgi:hypothetical protein
MSGPWVRCGREVVLGFLHLESPPSRKLREKDGATDLLFGTADSSTVKIIRVRMIFFARNDICVGSGTALPKTTNPHPSQNRARMVHPRNLKFCCEYGRSDRNVRPTRLCLSQKGKAACKRPLRYTFLLQVYQLEKGEYARIGEFILSLFC